MTITPEEVVLVMSASNTRYRRITQQSGLGASVYPRAGKPMTIDRKFLTHSAQLAAYMRVDLIDLIDHSLWVEADLTLGQTFHRFTQHTFEFMAVLDQGRLVGLCSRQSLGMLLGSQYGFSLYANKPLREHLRPDPVQISVESDIREAFEKVFARDVETFYDDVVVFSPSGQFIGLIFTQTLVKLQNHFHRENIRLLEEQGQEIDADLRLSRELQQALLPESYPAFPSTSNPDGSVLRFHHRYQSYGIVGGDFFHVQPISDLCAAVFIADVMGHGVRSALVTAMLRALLEELAPRSRNPGELLSQLNRKLAHILSRAELNVVFATALYMIVDAQTRSVAYATAGHPFPIRIGRRDQRTQVLQHEEAGTLLGFFEDLEYSTQLCTLEGGDSILLFTDGIFEVEDSGGELFGVPGMLRVIDNNLSRPTAEILDELTRAALGHSAHRQFNDDVSLLAIDFTS